MRALVVAAVAFVAITGLVDWIGAQAVDHLDCHEVDRDKGAEPGPGGNLTSLAAEPVIEGLDEPTDLFTLPGQPRLFVVEKPGRIVIVEDGDVLDPPMLDMTTLVLEESNEQGLLSVRPSPEFASDCLVYIFYTDSHGDSQLVSARVSGSEQPSIDVRTFNHLLTVPQRHRWHQSGTMIFGPEGDLWLGIGDGGGTGDPRGNGQDPHTLKGTILRIDVAGSAYRIPETNPFVESGLGRPEVWHYGLRNPWRISIDAETGLLYIPDVGQETTEELNIVDSADAGLNFGWSITEGSDCFESTRCDTSGLTPPVYEYRHEGSGCAIVGGQVYRGRAIPELDGQYFFSDYCFGWIRSLEYQEGTIVSEDVWPSLKVTRLVTSFGTDSEGELYFMSLDGGLWKIVPVREAG